MKIDKKSNDFTTVHWRRGDQLTERCGTLDNSVNCKTSKELIENIQKWSTGKAVYVATNERNVSELNRLTAAGYHTWHNLKINMTLNSVQVFVVELMLMRNSNTFLHWGHSTVSKFINQMRRRKYS